MAKQLIRFFWIFLLGIMVNAPAQAQEWFCVENNDIRYIDTALGKQKIMIFAPEEGEAKELIFFFHGDSAFRPPSYQYDMARRIVGHREGAMAVAVLRPGYEDGCGDKSEGDAGFKMGDNYTLEVVNVLAEVITAVQSEYPLETTLFGHSGGAALSAILMNRHPDLASAALLAACPCDLTAWRQHMYERTGNERWISDLPGLNPMQETLSLKREIKVFAFSDLNDQITPNEFTKEYVAKLKRRQLNAEYTWFSAGSRGTTMLQIDGHDAIIDDANLRFFLKRSYSPMD